EIGTAGEHAAQLPRIDAGGLAKLQARAELLIDKVSQRIPIIGRRNAPLVDAQTSLEVLTDAVHGGPGAQSALPELNIPPGGKARPLQARVILLTHAGKKALFRPAELRERYASTRDRLINRSVLGHLSDSEVFAISGNIKPSACPMRIAST